MPNSNYIASVLHLVASMVNGFIDNWVEITSIDACMDAWVIKALMSTCIGDECTVDGSMDDFLNNSIADILDT